MTPPLASEIGHEIAHAVGAYAGGLAPRCILTVDRRVCACRPDIRQSLYNSPAKPLTVMFAAGPLFTAAHIGLVKPDTKPDALLSRIGIVNAPSLEPAPSDMVWLEECAQRLNGEPGAFIDALAKARDVALLVMGWHQRERGLFHRIARDLASSEGLLVDGENLLAAAQGRARLDLQPCFRLPPVAEIFVG